MPSLNQIWRVKTCCTRFDVIKRLIINIKLDVLTASYLNWMRLEQKGRFSANKDFSPQKIYHIASKGVTYKEIIFFFLNNKKKRTMNNPNIFILLLTFTWILNTIVYLSALCFLLLLLLRNCQRVDSAFAKGYCQTLTLYANVVYDLAGRTDPVLVETAQPTATSQSHAAESGL